MTQCTDIYKIHPTATNFKEESDIVILLHLTGFLSCNGIKHHIHNIVTNEQAGYRIIYTIPQINVILIALWCDKRMWLLEQAFVSNQSDQNSNHLITLNEIKHIWYWRLKTYQIYYLYWVFINTLCVYWFVTIDTLSRWLDILQWFSDNGDIGSMLHPVNRGQKVRGRRY